MSGESRAVAKLNREAAAQTDGTFKTRAGPYHGLLKAAAVVGPTMAESGWIGKAERT
jgi:hypothetical protein